jgi:hypothetical protein
MHSKEQPGDKIVRLDTAQLDGVGDGFGDGVEDGLQVVLVAAVTQRLVREGKVEEVLVRKWSSYGELWNKTIYKRWYVFFCCFASWPQFQPNTLLLYSSMSPVRKSGRKTQTASNSHGVKTRGRISQRQTEQKRGATGPVTEGPPSFPTVSARGPCRSCLFCRTQCLEMRG